MLGPWQRKGFRAEAWRKGIVMNPLKAVHVRYPEWPLDPDALRHVDARRGLWYEDDKDRAAAARRAELRAQRLRWVRSAMQRRLTTRERMLVELHYFKAYSITHTAARAGITRQTAARALRRAVTKLRRAAISEGLVREEGS